MSRFRKLSHAIWHCQYHLVWTPKYRFRILTGEVAQEVNSCIRAFSEQLRCEVIELNVQIDHVHVLLTIPPKVAVSDYVGTVKGRTAIRRRKGPAMHRILSMLVSDEYCSFIWRGNPVPVGFVPFFEPGPCRMGGYACRVWRCQLIK